MFERFTEKAIKVIMLSQEEARRLGHNFVGTEQILLGLIGEGTGIAAKTLKSMGVNLKDIEVVRDKNGKLTNSFLVISNNPPTDFIRKGNERVITARFNDAGFFFKEDKTIKTN